ncbi:MAG: DNA recombination protein RmuC [Bacteroidales bacterium]
MENIIFLIIGLMTGAIISWFIIKYLLEKKTVLKTVYQALQDKFTALEYEKNIIYSNHQKNIEEFESLKIEYKTLRETKESISNRLSSAETKIESLTSYFDENKQLLKEKSNELESVTSKNAELAQHNKFLMEKLDTQKKELEEIGKKFTNEFKVLADQILETKSKKFTEMNEVKIKEILTPLGKDIDAFRKKVEETYDKESKERFSLEKQIKELVTLNNQISEDARHLTLALKGDSKAQGDWGELQLELILQKAGLEKDLHYRKQETIKDEHGKNFRPDYIINLPDDKNLIIDAKVSLTAYEQYFNTDDEQFKKRHIKEHLLSINKHIQELSCKNYQNLYGINTPDYVILFIPLEGALTVALREDSNILIKALEKNIVLVTTSMLLATLRIINLMWKQENQKRYVTEIANESGALYNKFIGFMSDLDGLGKKMDDAKSKYDDAMNKLYKSTKKGDTIVGRMENIKKLGANTNKALPQDILDKIDESESLKS